MYDFEITIWNEILLTCLPLKSILSLFFSKAAMKEIIFLKFHKFVDAFHLIGFDLWGEEL